MDIYTIVGHMTESEWNGALELRDRFRADPYVFRACQLVSDYFSRSGAIGIIRLKESAYFQPGLQVEDFLSALRELFPGPANN